MPYTFAHIGYILPIKKKWKDKFSITGLAFGSIAPDYDILFRLTKVRTHIFQYDFSTILMLIFPLAFLSAFLFHLFCRNILIENLPLFYEQKYTKYKTFRFTEEIKAHFLRIFLSIIVAILLHLILDFLCHCLNTYYIKMLVLQFTNNDHIANISYLFGLYGLPVLFSILGFYLLYFYEYHKNFLLKNLILTRQKFIFWSTLLLFIILLSFLKFCITEADKEFFADYIIISMTSSILLAIYATCAVYFLIQKIKKA